MSTNATSETSANATLVRVEPGTGLLRPVASPAQIIESHKEAVELIRDALQEGKDFGVIPGTGDKPGLFKAGAERLLAAFGLYVDTEIIEHECDHERVNTFSFKKWVAAKSKPSNWEELKSKGIGRNRKTDNGWQWQEAVEENGTSQGLYRYVVKATLRSRATDAAMGTGIGSCSSMETKYLRSPRDSENTVLKMAKKRALVDATLNTLALSDRFTQDVEDIPRHVINPDEDDAGAAVEASTPPQNTPASGAKAATLSPEEQGKLDRMKSAGAYLKGAGFDAEQYADFVKLITERKGSWVELAFESREAGCTTRDQILAYVESGELPVQEGEVVETPAGKPVATAESAPVSSASSATDGSTSAGDEPFGEVRLELAPSQKREIIGLIRGSGLTMEDILKIAETEKATTFDEVFVIAEREAGLVGAGK